MDIVILYAAKRHIFLLFIDLFCILWQDGRTSWGLDFGGRAFVGGHGSWMKGLCWSVQKCTSRYLYKNDGVVCVLHRFFVLLYFILCAVKGQVSVVHRRCSVFCHWKAGLPWMTGLHWRTGLQQGHWRAGLWQRAGLHGVQGRTPLAGRSLLKDVVGFFFLLEDSVLGGHDFTGRCSELYICL